MSIRAPTVNPFPNAGGLAFVRFDHAAGDAGTVLFAPLDPVLGGLTGISAPVGVSWLEQHRGRGSSSKAAAAPGMPGVSPRPAESSVPVSLASVPHFLSERSVCNRMVTPECRVVRVSGRSCIPLPESGVTR
jgi:hypothetical protein